MSSEFLNTNSDLTTIKSRKNPMDLPPEQAPKMSMGGKIKLGISAVALFAVLYVAAILLLGW